jgi:hypothetical protein
MILLKNKDIPPDLVQYFEPVNTNTGRNIWTIPTEAFKGAHFATFPTRLVEPCIKAGTSEYGVCAECGAQWKRVVEHKTSTNGQGPGYNLDSGRNDGKGRRHGGFNDAEFKTTGWKPACKCNAAVVPAVVLDPFGGSMTTALVALRLGRRYICCELNPEYCELGRKRLEPESNRLA